MDRPSLSLSNKMVFLFLLLRFLVLFIEFFFSIFCFLRIFRSPAFVQFHFSLFDRALFISRISIRLIGN